MASKSKIPSSVPLVGIVCCRTTGWRGMAYHQANESCINALQKYSNVAPLLVPSLMVGPSSPESMTKSLLRNLDGLLLAGSVSNVHPSLYGQESIDDNSNFDSNRDLISGCVIKHALSIPGFPIFGICRGLQELNVFLGGTLKRAAHSSSTQIEHRGPTSADALERYTEVHSVVISEGGVLEKVLRSYRLDTENVHVNSRHSEAIGVLSSRGRVEALAPDGIIEAASFVCDDSDRFVLGVQWHPEWKTDSNLAYRALFETFGQQCLKFSYSRLS